MIVGHKYLSENEAEQNNGHICSLTYFCANYMPKQLT